jgi:circadian clock protein KaiB
MVNIFNPEVPLNGPGGNDGNQKPADGALALKLFVIRGGANSELAIRNLSSVVSRLKDLKLQAVAEIVDISLQPEEVLQNNVVLTPTLIRTAPSPAVRIVGTLSDTERVVQVLFVEEPQNG